MSKVIGLTGGIASGKSTVSNLLQNLGAIIVDADEIAKRVVEKGEPALQEITAYFGSDVLLSDGSLCRKRLGNIVFNDKRKLSKLNEITHPYILKKIVDEINWYKTNKPHRVIILDAALLIEMKLMDLVDEIWLVALPVELQKDRLMEREGIGRKAAEKRIAAQMPLEDKVPYAHQIIDNSKSLEYLKNEVEKIWKKMDKS